MKYSSIAGLALLCSETCFATTWTVDDSGGADFTTIQAAVDAASDGDEILIYPGNYYGTGDEVVDTLGKSIWLHGASFDPTNTRIYGEETRRGITCRATSGQSNVTIENLYIIYGNAEEGGGIWIEGNPTITHCWITNNNATVGGNVYVLSGDPLFNGSTYFQTGVAEHGGGVYIRDGSPEFHTCFFRWNTATVRGGGIRGYQIAGTFTGCEFDTNDSPRGAGAAMYEDWQGNCSLFTNCEFKDNTSTNLGGGIENLYGADNTFDTCTFSNNIATNKTGGQGSGAGMYNDNADPVLLDCSFEYNIASGVGGGIYNWSAFSTVSSTLFYENTAISGGGTCIRSFGYGTFTDCTFDGNNATTSSYYNGGGAVFQNSVGHDSSGDEIDTTFIRCDFTNNDSNSQGGAMFFDYSSARLDGCSMSGNTAVNGGDGVAGFTANYSYENTNVINDSLFTDSVTLNYEKDSSCTVDGDWALFTHFCLVNSDFDINNLAGEEMLTINGTMIRGGSISIKNTSGTLADATVGSTIPLIHATSLAGEFDGTVLPAMPDGLGVELVENPISGGIEIALKVIDDAGAQYDNEDPIYIWLEPVDLLAFDADGDGRDEVVALFDGSPGFVKVYAISDESVPTEIATYSTSVGNSPVGLDASDLNNDSRDDLIIANSESQSLTVLVSQNSNTFNTVQTIDIGETITCVSFIDWDGNSNLDAVVGIDIADGETPDEFRVLSDVLMDGTLANTFEIPSTTLPDSTTAFDTATCVSGGDKTESWGFVGGTKYGQAYRVNSNGEMGLLAETMGNIVALIATELGDNGGDGQIDLIAASDETQALFLFEGDTTTELDFHDVIPLGLNISPSDVVALDADRDGDVDIVVCSPDSEETPLLLLRNGGATSGLVAGGLSGRSWSSQGMDSPNSPSRLTGGGAGGKDEDKDWLLSTGDPPELRDNCIMQQINLQGRMWTVDDSGGADFTTIQEAINAASDGESILVMAGTYTSSGNEVIDMSGKNVRLYSKYDAKQTIIDGQNARRGILCNSGETASCSIEGFTIQNTASGSGSGMYIDSSSPSISNCIFLNNTCAGAIYAIYATDMSIENCAFDGNTSGTAGGAIRPFNCNLSITNCNFTNNVASEDWWGGAIAFAGGNPEMGDTYFCGNSPEHIDGTYTDLGGNVYEDSCAGSCPADFNADGTVNVADLLTLIAVWGPCANDCPEDLDGNGSVEVADLLTLIAAWGACE